MYCVHGIRQRALCATTEVMRVKRNMGATIPLPRQVSYETAMYHLFGERSEPVTLVFNRDL